MMSEDVVKTGTTTVGIVCKDGIVLAADKRATAGYLIADKHTKKVNLLNDRIAVTMAGSASDGQLLVKLSQAEIRLKEIRTGSPISIKEAANLVGMMIYNNVRRMSMIPSISHFLMAGVDSEGFHLYDLFADGTVSEMNDYVSSGSGSVMAYGVLETLYNPEMSVADGIKLVVKCINAAVQRDIASGNGISVFTITKDGAREVANTDSVMKIEV